MTDTSKLAVVDTNVLISAVLFRGAVPRAAVARAMIVNDIVCSDATRAEARAVMMRSKFDRYLSLEERMAALEVVLGQMKYAQPVRSFSGCRYPKDEKFLDLAVGAGADFILTGDKDILDLHPFRGISILTPLQYINESNILNLEVS